MGCALICYLLWPLVRYLWDRLPVWVFLPAVALMYGITVFTTNGNLITIPVRLTQMIAGGCFARYMKQIKSIPLIGINVAMTVIAVVARKYLHAITVGSIVCWMLFVLIALLVACFPTFFNAVSPAIISAAALTYPIFLVHHKLISLLVTRFDLSHFPYHYVMTLFLIYFVLAVVVAKLLQRAASASVQRIKHCKELLSHKD